MSSPAVIGLDIAKNVFQVHGADAEGRCVLRRRLRRAEPRSSCSLLAFRGRWSALRPAQAAITGRASCNVSAMTSG
jgi:hypothetical protein